MSNMDLNIALFIGGTRKTGSSGFGFILGVGVLAGKEHEGDMIDRSPVSRVSTTENPIITIKNANDYVFYKLWDSSICPSDAKPGNRGGTLVIGITIPSQARMSGNKSPYSLLMEIYNTFLRIGTDELEIDTGEQKVKMRKFRDVELDKAEFIKIIDSYPLETATVKTAVMKGDTILEIQVPKEKMEDFFRDTQYPEFANYKAVEVTQQGNNMLKLEIPRPVTYEVFVDGESANRFLKDRKDEYTARKNPTEDYEYDSMTFSLGELLDNANGTKRNQSETVVVKLDKNNRRIDCKMTPKPINYKVVVKASDNCDSETRDVVEKCLKEGSVKIRFDGAELEYKKASIRKSEAKSAEKNNERFDVFPKEKNGYEFSVAKVRAKEFEKEVVVTLKAAKLKLNEHGGGQPKKEGGDKWKYLIGGAIGLVIGIGGTLGVQKGLEYRSINVDAKNEASAFYGANASSDTTEWKKYIENYSAPKFKHPVESHLSTIKEKLNQARLEAAGAAKEAQEEDAAYKKCIDETKPIEERIAACDAYIKAEYAKRKTEVVKLKSDLVQQQSNGAKVKAESDAFKAVEKAKSKNYPDNYNAYRAYKGGNYGNAENEGKVNDYIEEITRKRDDILKLLNGQELGEFNTNYGSNKWKKCITENERNAVCNILSPNYGDPVRNRNIKNYIKEVYGFPDKKSFKNWDEVKSLKRIMDTIQ